MTNIVPKHEDVAVLSKVLIGGDLAVLSEADRLAYYAKVCDSMGLNPLTQPFAYLKLNGKLVLYALKGATEQIAAIHGISVTLGEVASIQGVVTVRAKATGPSGRTADATGVVSIEGLKGEALANAFMKAETKASRRAVLRYAGLGMLDETEAGDGPGPRHNASGSAPGGHAYARTTGPGRANGI